MSDVPLVEVMGMKGMVSSGAQLAATRYFHANCCNKTGYFLMTSIYLSECCAFVSMTRSLSNSLLALNLFLRAM